MIIEDFSHQLQGLIDENKVLKQNCDEYFKQLCVIAIELKPENMVYPDLTKIDWSKVRFSYNFSTIHVLNKSNNHIISTWEEMLKL